MMVAFINSYVLYLKNSGYTYYGVRKILMLKTGSKLETIFRAVTGLLSFEVSTNRSFYSAQVWIQARVSIIV